MAEVILWAVCWYLQFPISYRDLERMLEEYFLRTLSISRGGTMVIVLTPISIGLLALSAIILAASVLPSIGR
ncbi:hypothetical protein [Azospirillum oleiclasticum]|uniref:hypothetical protein n=1 Tax=Azospirillum oleiclasticum TaxID=2735135 RepID=UPI001B3BDD00|nr:hypothetical protein [Azospirillum oleiclasticum]